MCIGKRKIASFIVGGLACICAAIILASGNSEVNTDVEFSQTLSEISIAPRQKSQVLDSISQFPNGTQFAIALIQGEETRFIGLERDDDRVFPIENLNSAFEIGSITKVFTATLLADFVLSEIIAVDEYVNGYLPIQLKDNQDATFLHLANHTSGMPRTPSNVGILSLISPGSDYKYYDKTDLYNYLSNDLEVIYGVGEEFLYSNLGMSLLGVTLSEIADQPYEDLLQERVLTIYAMKNTTTLRDRLETTLVQGLDKSGGRAGNWDLNILAPSGALLSTTQDLSRFVRAHFDPDDELLALTRSRTSDKGVGSGYRTLGMGLGWTILQPNETEIWYWHNGGTGGFSSSIVFDVEKRIGVVVLSNVAAANNQSRRITQLSFLLMNEL